MEAENPLKLSGELTIRRADELHKLFVQAAGQTGDVVLDLSEIDACDAAALQLICALRKTLGERGSALGIAAVSPAVELTAVALGLPIAESGCVPRGGRS